MSAIKPPTRRQLERQLSEATTALAQSAEHAERHGRRALEREIERLTAENALLRDRCNHFSGLLDKAIETIVAWNVQAGRMREGGAK